MTAPINANLNLSKGDHTQETFMRQHDSRKAENQLRPAGKAFST
jgi:hypothetical protein